jgi:hypothetical protein
MISGCQWMTKYTLSRSQSDSSRTKQVKKDRLPSSIRTLHSLIVYSAQTHRHCVPTACDYWTVKRHSYLRVLCMIRERCKGKKGRPLDAILTLHLLVVHSAQIYLHCVPTARDYRMVKRHTYHRMACMNRRRSKGKKKSRPPDSIRTLHSLIVFSA